MKKVLLCVLLISVLKAFAVEVPINIFPLDKYNQDINYWVKTSDLDYDKPLIAPAMQKKQRQEHYRHCFASGAQALSPWGYKYVTETLAKKPIPLEDEIIKKYNNYADKDQKLIGYGENFKPYSKEWLTKIIYNMNLKQFKLPIKYNPNRRGIVVKNLHARSLPTNDPYFYNFTLPGEGYPFDNLQESALWVGTPLYIVGETIDQQWSLVLTPSFMAWVESSCIAKASPSFIDKWQRYAKKMMVAITKTNIAILDIKKRYRFNAYIGTVFPGKKIYKNTISVLIPMSDLYYNARIIEARISKKNAIVMPLRATPHNFANLISALLGRPYGWGNMYFYNDCSAELQNLYTPFGIWLPRNSGAQIKTRTAIDKSESDLAERLKYLQENGKKFITLIYIDGHVMMYLGNYPNPNTNEHEPVIMTYQNIWGLKPKDKSYRDIIGQTVLLPLLTAYPEDPRVNSLANWDHFKISYLDQPICN